MLKNESIVFFMQSVQGSAHSRRFMNKKGNIVGQYSVVLCPDRAMSFANRSPAKDGLPAIDI